MAAIFDVSPVWLIYGVTGEKADPLNQEAAMIISTDGKSYRNSESCLYYEVKSDEMSPTLEIGDTAVIDRNVRTFDQTGIYLVNVAGVSLLRRFRRAMDGTIRVSCDNSSKYPEVETLGVEKDIEILGLVVSKVSVERVS